MIARMPAQKLGIASHRLWMVEMNHSSLPRTCVALRMPSGRAMIIEIIIAATVSSMVAGARAWSSLEIGCPLNVDLPRSPWSRCPTHTTYWTRSG